MSYANNQKEKIINYIKNVLDKYQAEVLVHNLLHPIRR